MPRTRPFAAGAVIALSCVSWVSADDDQNGDGLTTCAELKLQDSGHWWGWNACHNQHFFDSAFDTSPQNRPNDQPAIIYQARGTPKRELLVFLPGGGGTAGKYDEFMTMAAELGYDVVGIGIHSYTNALFGGPPVHTQPGDLCGCFGACHGQWHARQFAGGTGGSQFPDVPAPSSIKRRLRKVLEHYRDAPNWDGHERWGSYLCTDNEGDCVEGQVKWKKVVLAGHSDGSRLSTYIASQKQVKKVILFSAIPENLDKEQGCEGCDPIYGPNSSPAFANTYSTGFCTPTTAHPPDYIWKHTFGDHDDGPPYATGRAKFWALDDSTDDKCTKAVSERTLGAKGLTLDELHDPGLPDGFAFWGPNDPPSGTYPTSYPQGFSGYHVILANALCGDNPHNATVQDRLCSLPGSIYRRDIWNFFLTR